MVFVARSTATADGPGWTGAEPTRADPKDPEPDDTAGMLSRLAVVNGPAPGAVAGAGRAGWNTRPAEADATGAGAMTAASMMASRAGAECRSRTDTLTPLLIRRVGRDSRFRASQKSGKGL